MRGFRTDYGRQSSCISVDRFVHLCCDDQCDFDLKKEPTLKNLSFVFQSAVVCILLP